MIKLEKSFFISSARQFLADTSISLTIIIFLLLFDKNIIDLIKNLPKEYVLFLSVIMMMLSYTFGLSINALSYFLVSPIVSRVELDIVFGRSYLSSNYTKKIYDFKKLIEYFKISNENEYINVASILAEMENIFMKYNIDIRHVSGIRQYFRNAVIVILPLTIYHNTTIFAISISFFATLISIHVCAQIKFYQIAYSMYIANILHTTLCSDKIVEGDSSVEVAYQLFRDLEEYHENQQQNKNEKQSQIGG